MSKENEVARAIDRAFVMEAPLGGALGVVEMLQSISTQQRRIADAIMADVMPGTDATGGHVACLSEAVMGNTAGLMAIAEALNRLADAHERLAESHEMACEERKEERGR